MQMNDMVLISADDPICEPPNMFDNQLSGELLASAPKNRADRNGNNYREYQGHIRPLTGLNAVVGRPFEEYGMEPSAFSQRRSLDYHHAVIGRAGARGLVAVKGTARLSGPPYHHFRGQHRLGALPDGTGGLLQLAPQGLDPFAPA